MKYVYRIVGTLIGIGIAILINRLFNIPTQWQLVVWLIMVFISSYIAERIYNKTDV